MMIAAPFRRSRISVGARELLYQGRFYGAVDEILLFELLVLSSSGAYSPG